MTTVYRATRNPDSFQPLDGDAPVSRNGWRFNDRETPILYAATVQSLAILEVVARPGWERVKEIGVFPIELPDGSVVTLSQLGIVLPVNWNNRPAASTARRIGAEFLRAIDQAQGTGPMVSGVMVPSVISTADSNVLLDPRQTDRFRVGTEVRIPFDWFAAAAT